MSSLVYHIMVFKLVLTGIAALLLAVLVRSLFHRWQLHQKAQQWGCEPPNKYPHRLPWGIDLYRLQMDGAKKGRYHRLSIDLFNRHGPTYESHLFGTRYINTRDTKNLQAFLANNHTDYCKNTMQRAVMLPLLGQGILSSNGPEWRKSRELVKPLFKRAQVGDIDRFEKYVNKMIKLLPRDGSTIDLAPLLQKLVIDSSTEFIFGHSLNCLDDKTGKADEFLKVFDQALAGAGKRGTLAGGKLMFLFKLEDKKWLETCSRVHAFVDSWIARALSEEPDSKSDSQSSSQQQHYILVNEMAKEIKDAVRLRSELLNIFSPSRGTTTALLSNTLFYLARTPTVWAELRRQALDLGDTSITFEVLKSLHLFRYTLQEAIRLQGPSGQVHRQALRDTVLPRGGGPTGTSPILVPKGAIVVGNNYPIYHDPEIWGDDVEEFRPSRFYGKVLTWEFVPFLGGPRICPAQQQVYTHGTYLLYRLVREFETLENRDPCLAYIEEMGMLCQSRNGVQVAVHRAKDGN